MLEQAAARGEAPDRAPLEAAAAELTRRREEFGVLVSPAARDLDVARAELRETRTALSFATRARMKDPKFWRFALPQCDHIFAGFRSCAM